MNRSARPLKVVALAAAMVAMAAQTVMTIAPAGASPRRVNLIGQGEFEVHIPSTGFARLYKAGDHIGPWSVSGATVGVGRPFPPIVTGISGRKQQFLSLKDPTASTAVSDGTVCQIVDVSPSTSYRLRFYSAAATTNDTLIVRWQGNTVGKFHEVGSLGTTAWTLRTIALGSPKGTTGNMCFTGKGTGFPLVDAVQLSPTTP